MSSKQETAHREEARRFAQHGIGDLARAFNHCHNPAIAYRYSEAVQQRFLELGAELVALVEKGQIVPRRAVHAQGDADFQRHMSALLSTPSTVPEGPAA
jgi:hypothetical protein